MHQKELHHRKPLLLPPRNHPERFEITDAISVHSVSFHVYPKKTFKYNFSPTFICTIQLTDSYWPRMQKELD